MSDQIINNPKALDQYIELMGEEGKEFIAEIIDTFLNTADENISQLDKSLADKDPVIFRRAAHTLKTGCSTVGAERLAESFLELEEAGARGNLDSLGIVLESCKNKLASLVTELENKKSSLEQAG